MILLPGFRDFYPEDCARRHYLVATWRTVCRRHGFVEYDGPMLEPVDLYRKKSGGELVGQLFDFTDKGGREVTLRPEMTPTLARMFIARERAYKKPAKWFSIAPFFRYEKQQRGRLREFLQLNCDILGEASPAADAELIALAIALLQELGFTAEDFVVRVSDRGAWTGFAERVGLAAERLPELLEVIDKTDRTPVEIREAKLHALGVAPSQLDEFLAHPSSPALAQLRAELAARELTEFVEIDLGIVRGLAYYTGLVFEIWDRRRTLRAVAGGGRYDQLLATLSEGKVDLPALGFAIGDVVLAELIHETAAARTRRETAIARESALDAYLIIAQETQRPAALADSQQLRRAGYRIDYPLTATNVGKQFQTAGQLGARFSILYGEEMPLVKIKNFTTREEELIPRELLPAHLSPPLAPPILLA